MFHYYDSAGKKKKELWGRGSMGQGRKLVENVD